MASMSTRRGAPLLLWAVACGGDGTDPAAVAPTDVVATVSDAMPTVVTVTWRTADPASGYVRFGSDGSADRQTLATAVGTDHQAMLVALAPESDVVLTVVSEGVESDPITVTTGAVPGDPPIPTVEGAGQDRFVVLPMLADDIAHPTVFDPQGRVVWYHTDTRDLQVFRSRVSVDGSGIVYASTVRNGLPAEDSKIVRVSWEGTETSVIDVPNLTHDFVELPDGTIVSLAAESRDGVEGNKLIAIAEDGTTTDVWSAWDCFDPVAHPSTDPVRDDWTHANALDYDPVRDAFYVSLRNLGTIAHVDRTTGQCDWAFGGSGGDVDVTGATFVHQHQFHRIDGGLLVFDNDGATGFQSRVVEFSFDDQAKTASLIREIYADPTLYSFILGDVQRLDDGDTHVVWSTAGIVDRYGADGTRRWRMSVPDLLFGFSQTLADPGRPNE